MRGSILYYRLYSGVRKKQRRASGHCFLLHLLFRGATPESPAASGPAGVHLVQRLGLKTGPRKIGPECPKCDTSFVPGKWRPHTLKNAKSMQVLEAAGRKTSPKKWHENRAEKYAGWNAALRFRQVRAGVSGSSRLEYPEGRLPERPRIPLERPKASPWTSRTPSLHRYIAIARIACATYLHPATHAGSARLQARLPASPQARQLAVLRARRPAGPETRRPAGSQACKPARPPKGLTKAPP